MDEFKRVDIPIFEKTKEKYVHTCGVCGHSYKDEYERPVPYCPWCGEAWVNAR